jgi:hypothetical protein
MLIRVRKHWSLLLLPAIWVVAAIFIVEFRTDHTMVPLYLGTSCLIILAWSTTYTTLSISELTKRTFFFFLTSFPVNEIESIEPHKNNGKWGYGTVIVIWSKTGQKLTLQPNHPKPFLEMLRKQAPQAEYLL